jgi:hypothetical protein
VKRDLTQTRNEIEETTRKRFSDELYADVTNSNPYESNEFPRNSMNYESVDYDGVYDMPKTSEPQYLTLFRA